jgi:hypothetical protein
MPESSPELVTDEVKQAEPVAAETADVKVSSAESSPAETQGEKGTLLDAVKAALKPPTEKAPDSKTEGSEPDKAAKPDEGKEVESDEHTEEELARLRPKTRKRIENLVAARRELEGHLAEIRPKAEQFDKVMRFIEDAKLTTDEVNDAFDVAKSLKNEDFHGAYNRLKPIVDKLESLLGIQLPDDLVRDVNEGRLPEDRARELARTKSQAAIASSQAARRATEAEEQRRLQHHQGLQTRVQTAIADWETSKGRSDPDWKQKQSRVMEIVELETARRERRDPNFAWSPEEALKFAETALQRATDEIRRYAPKPKAITPITDVASTRSSAPPTTALEAAKQGLARLAG